MYTTCFVEIALYLNVFLYGLMHIICNLMLYYKIISTACFILAQVLFLSSFLLKFHFSQVFASALFTYNSMPGVFRVSSMFCACGGQLVNVKTGLLLQQVCHTLQPKTYGTRKGKHICPHFMGSELFIYTQNCSTLFVYLQGRLNR